MPPHHLTIAQAHSGRVHALRPGRVLAPCPCRCRIAASPSAPPPPTYIGYHRASPNTVSLSPLLLSIPLFPKPKLPLAAPNATFGRRDARRRSGRTGDLRPPPTASRGALHYEEPNPSINLDVAPPGSCAPGFFPVTGHHRPFRRRFLFGDPLSDYLLSEHLLTSLYLPISLIGSLVFSRIASTVEHLRRRRLASPGHLRSPRLPPTAPTLEFTSKIIDDQATSLSE